MKLLVIFVVVVSPILAFGQMDTAIYFGPNGTLESNVQRTLRKDIRQKNKRKVKIKTWKLEEGNETLLFSEKIILKDPEIHNIRIEGKAFIENITRKFEEHSNGLYRFTELQNHQVKRTGAARSKIPLILHGKVTEYYPGGNVKSISIYENNELLSNENWKESGEKYIDNLFYSVDQEPLFLRGNKFLHSHVLKAFKDSKTDLTQVEGRIVVGFVVMEDGNIDGIQIEKGIAPHLNNLAVQSLNSLPGKWQPARLDGRDVRFYQLFPINFIYHQVDFDNLELRGSMLYWEIN